MGTKFKDYVEEVEADLSEEGRAILEGFRSHYDLAAQLLELRRERELTQKELAHISGIPQSEISRIERGVANPTKATLEALGGALKARLAFVREPSRTPAGVAGTRA